MEILIQNKHMKGNSWLHGANPSGRQCPLHEALTEMYPDDSFLVGGYLVRINGKSFIIPQNWRRFAAIDHIEKAQTDENYTVLVRSYL